MNKFSINLLNAEETDGTQQQKNVKISERGDSRFTFLQQQLPFQCHYSDKPMLAIFALIWTHHLSRSLVFSRFNQNYAKSTFTHFLFPQFP